MPSVKCNLTTVEVWKYQADLDFITELVKLHPDEDILKYTFESTSKGFKDGFGNSWFMMAEGPVWGLHICVHEGGDYTGDVFSCIAAFLDKESCALVLQLHNTYEIKTQIQKKEETRNAKVGCQTVG